MKLKVKLEGNVASFGIVCSQCGDLLVDKFKLTGLGFAALARVVKDFKHDLDIVGIYICPSCANQTVEETENDNEAKPKEFSY